MPDPCPLCGARLGSLEGCRARFEQCLALEYEHPTAYGAVHHLLVPTYMLQHNAYSARGWRETRRLLERFVRDTLSPQEARRAQGRLEAGRRNWSFTRGSKLPGLDRIVWTRTIADTRLHDPELYCDDVRAWAGSVLNDTQALVRSDPLEKEPP